MKLSDLRTARTILANRVEFHFRQLVDFDIPIHGVEFGGSISAWTSLPGHDSPKYLAEYWGHAQFNGRLFEVHCCIPVDSFEEAVTMDDRRLVSAEWQQEKSFIGWIEELRSLYENWRSFRLGEVIEE